MSYNEGDRPQPLASSQSRIVTGSLELYRPGLLSGKLEPFFIDKSDYRSSYVDSLEALPDKEGFSRRLNNRTSDDKHDPSGEGSVDQEEFEELMSRLISALGKAVRKISDPAKKAKPNGTFDHADLVQPEHEVFASPLASRRHFPAPDVSGTLALAPLLFKSVKTMPPTATLLAAPLATPFERSKTTSFPGAMDSDPIYDLDDQVGSFPLHMRDPVPRVYDNLFVDGRYMPLTLFSDDAIRRVHDHPSTYIKQERGLRDCSKKNMFVITDHEDFGFEDEMSPIDWFRCARTWLGWIAKPLASGGLKVDNAVVRQMEVHISLIWDDPLFSEPDFEARWWPCFRKHDINERRRWFTTPFRLNIVDWGMRLNKLMLIRLAESSSSTPSPSCSAQQSRDLFVLPRHPRQARFQPYDKFFRSGSKGFRAGSGGHGKRRCFGCGACSHDLSSCAEEKTVNGKSFLAPLWIIRPTSKSTVSSPQRRPDEDMQTIGVYLQEDIVADHISSPHAHTQLKSLFDRSFPASPMHSIYQPDDSGNPNLHTMRSCSLRSDHGMSINGFIDTDRWPFGWSIRSQTEQIIADLPSESHTVAIFDATKVYKTIPARCEDARARTGYTVKLETLLPWRKLDGKPAKK
ncbi:hypothetical protein K488DRAFT_71484 [Vararia minispora EC-137]|uniref:Uncharacterized protein n=1 Tax=Vararia minispora EC-137 TaxID=1314806 RepID=A0ACB8QHN5_9AGAM|nr:hypothetical protein K488DRAFT_71484 [Vararia minispora EC-137]